MRPSYLVRLIRIHYFPQCRYSSYTMIVIPIQTIHRLLDFAERHRLSIPIPLMSPCSGYFAVDGMSQVLSTLAAVDRPEAHNLVAESQDQAQQNHPVVRC